MKRYILALALGWLATSGGLASETRVQTLGGERWLLVDDSNLFDFPAQVLSFPNRLIAELGTHPGFETQGRSAGLLVTNNQEMSWGVLAVFANRPYPQIEEFERVSRLVPALLVPEPKFELLYGREIRGLETGVGIEWADARSESRWNDTTYIRSSRLLGLKLGLHLALGEESLLDLRLGARQLSFSVEEEETVRDRAEPCFDLGGSFSYRVSDFLALVPYLSMRRDDLSYELAEAGGLQRVNWAETSLRGGVGLNASPYREMTLVVALLGEETESGYDSTSDGVKYEYGETYQTAPAVSLGLESELRDWLYLRLGARKSVQRYEKKLIEGDLTETSVACSAPFDLSFGLGLKLGELLLDAELADDFPFTLGYALSGRTAEVFTRLSATYSFEIF